MSETIDNASFSFGFMCAEIEFSFGEKRRREAWLTKIGATKSWLPLSQQGAPPVKPTHEIWTLPDGAYARFSLPGNVGVWKAAGQALARHMCEEIARHEANPEPPLRDFAADFRSKDAAVDDAGQTI